MNTPLQLVDYPVASNSFPLFQPEQESMASRYRNGEIPFPYWSQVWPAAIGLATFIFQQPQYTTNKKVLELAAGLGLPSLVAAATGATNVTASDYVPEAVAAMQQTIAHHQLKNTDTCLLDWTNLPAGLMADTLLLSDVSYDAKLFGLQEKVIQGFLQSGTTVIISTPQRLVAKQAIQPLLSFCKQSEEMRIQQNERTTAISIFVLQR